MGDFCRCMNEKGKSTLDRGQPEQTLKVIEAPGEWSSVGGGACEEDGAKCEGSWMSFGGNY